MNRESSDSSDRSDIEHVVNLVCREFEGKFRADATFRIENLLDGIQHQFQNFESKLDHYRAKHRAITELIFVEMEMRWTAGQPIDAAEYLRRFPDFSPAIDESLNRLLQRHISFRETCFLVSVHEKVGSHADEYDFQLQLDPSCDAGIPKAFGPYHEISQIKSGSFGIVCRAIDRRDGRAVALKFPRKDKLSRDPELKMFLAEANRAMKLDHPGIAKTYSIEKSNGYLAIVQELIDGPDLATAKAQLHDQKDIALLVAQIADALTYAHQKGVYHRDLKPANILLDRQGRPHIVDFGLAINESELIYVPGQRCGTAQYMPPEQVAGLTRLLDGRSDIWSLGVIFYELLTKERPFNGITEREIYDLVETKDPRPLRQIDDSIDPELQRICLKCLEKYQRCRYLTADDLARDLRHWAALPAHKTTPSDSPAPFLPKGLRSYSAEDAQFFIDLLPGPRDRYGIPGTIRFWESRICEPVPPANRVPVGVIFGPSGSGKSSFIKAGLLPLLASNILTVYVEATQADTEVRLLKALRQRLDGLPEKISLPELFRGLSSGRWRPAGFSKILIVIDQFEQWLSRSEDFATSQLARAMRFCDGQQLQCLLLTRDDFMMALSRFADALEMDVREGENAQAIDLFDRKHARKVLAKLGRAYERLPAEPAELSEPQEAFLEETVDQLAADDHVICVHLVLFSEMFRQRPWTTAELKQVGGVAGTGEKFLEATFGSASRDKRYRTQHDPAQRVLGALLPAAGSDIRGAMKPERELIVAANMQSHPEQFDKLIKSLDSQLKLITRTDPDLPPDPESKGLEPIQRNGWYQLTHDYLVPSVRNWLDSTLRKSRGGRAQLRLRDLAAQVVPGLPPPNLPTNLEWLAWQFQIPSSGLTPNEHSVLHHARRRFLQQAGIAAAVLLLIGTLLTFALVQNAKQDRIAEVERLIGRLINEEVSSTPAIVDQLKNQRQFAEPRLRAIVNNASTPADDRLRATIGLLPFDKTFIDTIVAAITAPECPPDQLIAFVTILERYAPDSQSKFATHFDDPTADPRSRFRAACAEIFLGRSQRNFVPHSETMATILCGEPISFVDSWLSILKNECGELEPAFVELFTVPNDETKDPAVNDGRAFVLAEALYVFKAPDVRFQELAQFIPSANSARFNAIISVIEQHGTGDLMAEALEGMSVDPSNAIGIANRAIALARLGRKHALAELYGGEFDSLQTFLAINFSAAPRLRLHDLREIYDELSIDQTKNTNHRQSVLQALGLQAKEILGPDTKAWLSERARYHVLNDQDACCFSTAELILRRLESDSIESLRAERRTQKQNATDVRFGNVMINKALIAFSIVDIPMENGESYPLAVSTSEVTNGELFRATNDPAFAGLPPSQPFQFHKNSVLVACKFCESMDDADSSFYPRDAKLDDIMGKTLDFSRSGYRLPTNAEWTAFCKSNRVMEGLLFDWPRTATNYAWVFENSRDDLQDVGRLLPNAAGLFDTFGNVQELCHSRGPDSPFVQKGQSTRTRCSGLNIAISFFAEAYFDEPSLIGFRIVNVYAEQSE